MPARRKKSSTLQEVRNPLVFFSLALLVVEAVMGGIVAYAKMSDGYTFAAFCIMAALFLVVVGVVAGITIYLPRHLYESVREDLAKAREVAEFVKSPAFREVVQSIMEDMAKSDAQLDAGPHPRRDEANK